MIYILKFSSPLGTARHYARYYVGYCADDRLDERLAEHRAGCGAAITRAANERGIAYEVVHTLPGDRKLERKIKNYKNTGKLVKQLERGTFNL